MGWGKVTVVGRGYVGLPLAMRAVEVGYHVVGFDTDDELAKRLALGESHVEDVPAAQVAAALATRRYRVTSRCEESEGFDVVVITVPTPFGDGAPTFPLLRRRAERLLPRCGLTPP
jgi:UDP-N-acetyl-D-glucosamine dehydrogenase